MKKALFTFMFLCLGGMLTAQETQLNGCKLFANDTIIFIGDTIEWQPSVRCDSITYSISRPEYISYEPLRGGMCLQIIAKKVGMSYISVRCEDDVTDAAAINVTVREKAPVYVQTVEKPQTQAFTETYKYTPPTDNYFITLRNQVGQFDETYIKCGDEEAFNDGVGFDRIWNVKTGKVWYYCPDAQGWTDDVDWEFEPFDGCPALNAFDKEVEDKSNLSKYYVGKEKAFNTDCWRFYVEQEDGSVIQYWVNPANGCTLKRQFNNQPAKEVTVYNLNYTRLNFGPKYKKGLHDNRR